MVFLDAPRRLQRHLTMAFTRPFADMNLSDTPTAADPGEEDVEKPAAIEDTPGEKEENGGQETENTDSVSGTKGEAQAMPSTIDEQKRWQHIDNIISSSGQDEEMIEALMTLFDRMKVLVIGAGGLGCEILKNLALSKFRNIHVIDMDTIDISNLNRQFLFRRADVGKFKADVAARFVMNRVRGVSITPHCCKIQDYHASFYKQFQLIICGLDSVEARRWINAMLISISEEGGGDPDSLIPLIDGGTEGFKGQARVVLPTMTSCIECQLDMHVPRQTIPLCTIASIPRQPEHCIEWAHIIAWDEQKPFPRLDMDEPEHVMWIYERALERAKQFNIEGITYAMTQGVIKNIIPAIASTNAVIAAACCNEAFKLATGAANSMGLETNYMMYSGNDGIYTYTFKHEQKKDCPVCGGVSRPLVVKDTETLEEVLESLATRPEAQLKQPSMRALGKTLYMRSPPSLEEKTRPNLKRTLLEMGIVDGQEVVVTDLAFPLEFNFVIRVEKTK